MHPSENATALTQDQAILLACRDGPAPPFLTGDSSAHETLVRIGKVIGVVADQHPRYVRCARQVAHRVMLIASDQPIQLFFADPPA